MLVTLHRVVKKFLFATVPDIYPSIQVDIDHTHSIPDILHHKRFTTQVFRVTFNPITCSNTQSTQIQLNHTHSIKSVSH